MRNIANPDSFFCWPHFENSHPILDDVSYCDLREHGFPPTSWFTRLFSLHAACMSDFGVAYRIIDARRTYADLYHEAKHMPDFLPSRMFIDKVSSNRGRSYHQFLFEPLRGRLHALVQDASGPDRSRIARC